MVWDLTWKSEEPKQKVRLWESCAMCFCPHFHPSLNRLHLNREPVNVKLWFIVQAVYWTVVKSCITWCFYVTCYTTLFYRTLYNNFFQRGLWRCFAIGHIDKFLCFWWQNYFQMKTIVFHSIVHCKPLLFSIFLRKGGFHSLNNSPSLDAIHSSTPFLISS